MPRQLSMYCFRKNRQNFLIAIGLFVLIFWQGSLFAQTEHSLEQAYQKALLTERQGRFIESLGLLKDVAERGHPGAQNYYGYMLDKSDEDKEAVKWYKKSADQNYIDGMLSLAKMYAAGEGVKQDIPQAIKLYEKAIELGSVGAMKAFAYAYKNGSLSFEKNNELALQWFNRAAALDDIGSMIVLAQANENGQMGLSINNAEAIAWYTKAAENGDYSSIKKLLTIYKKGGLGEKPDSAKAEQWRLKLEQPSENVK